MNPVVFLGWGNLWNHKATKGKISAPVGIRDPLEVSSWVGPQLANRFWATCRPAAQRWAGLPANTWRWPEDDQGTLTGGWDHIDHLKCWDLENPPRPSSNSLIPWVWTKEQAMGGWVDHLDHLDHLRWFREALGGGTPMTSYTAQEEVCGPQVKPLIEVDAGAWVFILGSSTTSSTSLV